MSRCQYKCVDTSQAKCASERSCGSAAGWPHIPATCTHFAPIVHFCPFLPQPQTPCSRMRPGSGLALTRVMMRCSHPVGQATAKVRARALFRRGQGSRQQPCPCHSLPVRAPVCWLLAPLPRLGYLSCSMPWPPVSVALLFNLKFLPFCEQVAQGPTLLVVGHQASDLSVVPAVQPAAASVVPVGDYNCRIVTMEAKTCFFRDEGTPWLCQTCVLGCNHAYLQVVVGRMGAGGHYPGNRHGVPTPDCNMVHVAHAYHAFVQAWHAYFPDS